MGFFNFSSKPEETLNWSSITSVEMLVDVYSNSESKPNLFFKHSTRCSISSMALNGFERNWNKEVECNLYFIDLIAHRDVSQKLAELSGVIHQSPQAIVVSANKIIYSATHSGIDAADIESRITTK